MNKLEAIFVHKYYLELGDLRHKFEDHYVPLSLPPGNEIWEENLHPSITREEAAMMIPSINKDDLLSAMRVAAVRILVDEGLMPKNILRADQNGELSIHGNLETIANFIKTLVDTGNPKYRNMATGFFQANGQLRNIEDVMPMNVTDASGTISSLESPDFNDLGHLQNALDQAVQTITKHV